MLAERRLLIITADDFGVGLETSRGILDLADCGMVTSTVLLVNSPFASASLDLWRKRGQQLEIGWHPCLTLDEPILPPEQVPTLVNEKGRFQSLGQLLQKLLLGRVNEQEIEAELAAQYQRFLDLVGYPPLNVNGHHHCHIFRPVRDAMLRVLGKERPYIRRIHETFRTLRRIPGARIKRLALSKLAQPISSDYPGNQQLLGVTDPPFVHDKQFFRRWLNHSHYQYLELTCHPGHLDLSLAGRDGSIEDGQLPRREAEWKNLNDPNLRGWIEELGMQLVNARQWIDIVMPTANVQKRAA